MWEERCLSHLTRQPGLEGRRLLGGKKLLPVTGGRVFVTRACALAQRWCKYLLTHAVLAVKTGTFRLHLAARLYATYYWNCEISQAPGVSGWLWDLADTDEWHLKGPWGLFSIIWTWKIRGFLQPWFQLLPLKKQWRSFQGPLSPERARCYRGSSSGSGHNCQVKLLQPLLWHCKNWHQPVLLGVGRKSWSWISSLTKQQTGEFGRSSWCSLVAWLWPGQWSWDHRWRERCRKLAPGLFQFWQSSGRAGAAVLECGR